jgi:biotin operon repressor
MIMMTKQNKDIEMKKNNTTSHITKMVQILTKTDKPVTAKQLATRAGMPYDSVSKRVYDLRERGYNVNTVTVKGIDGEKVTRYELA